MSLMKLIANYDYEQQEYIRSLEARIQELEIKNNELLGLAMSGVQAREESMLKLIMSGALKRPEKCEQCEHTPIGKMCIACNTVRGHI